MTKFHSNVIESFINEHIQEILDHFGIEYYKAGNRYTFICPIHSCADNPNGLLMYSNDESMYWKCQTHHCEQEFGTQGIDFIKGCLKARGKEGSYADVRDFCKSLGATGAHQDNEYLSVIKFINVFGDTCVKEKKQVTLPTRDMMRAKLKLQPEDFLKRGFSSSLLDKYDIGYCDDKEAPMYRRVVVPLYDDNGEFMVGCTGRATGNIKPKWLHNEGLQTGNILFNLWFAKQFMKEYKMAILCEGPCDALRLIDNNIPAMAMFNADLKRGQLNLLDKYGVINLIMMLDNDSTGIDGFTKISELYSRYYRIFPIRYSSADPGNLSTEEIEESVKPQLRKLIVKYAY